jgi:hypothetical protein
LDVDDHRNGLCLCFLCHDSMRIWYVFTQRTLLLLSHNVWCSLNIFLLTLVNLLVAKLYQSMWVYGLLMNCYYTDIRDTRRQQKEDTRW